LPAKYEHLGLDASTSAQHLLMRPNIGRRDQDSPSLARGLQTLRHACRDGDDGARYGRARRHLDAAAALVALQAHTITRAT